MCSPSHFLSLLHKHLLLLSEICQFTSGDHNHCLELMAQLLIKDSRLKECLLGKVIKLFCMIMSNIPARGPSRKVGQVGSCNLKWCFSNYNLPIIYHVSPFFSLPWPEEHILVLAKCTWKSIRRGEGTFLGHSMSFLFEEFLQFSCFIHESDMAR